MRQAMFEQAGDLGIQFPPCAGDGAAIQLIEASVDAFFDQVSQSVTARNRSPPPPETAFPKAYRPKTCVLHRAATADEGTSCPLEIASSAPLTVSHRFSPSLAASHRFSPSFTVSHRFSPFLAASHTSRV